jgi:hypothetical protein
MSRISSGSRRVTCSWIRRSRLGGHGIVGYDLIQRRNPSFVTRGHFVVHVQARFVTHAASAIRTNTAAALLGFAIGY